MIEIDANGSYNPNTQSCGNLNIKEILLLQCTKTKVKSQKA